MIRHFKFPKTLYRLQNSLRFKIKEKQQALKKRKHHYQYVANQRGLYIPRNSKDVQNSTFQPNGVQLFSMSQNFKNVITNTIKGGFRFYYVIQFPQGLTLPSQTVLLQDPVEDSIFWLETQVPTEPKFFNSKVELLFLENKIHRKKEFKQWILSLEQKKKEMNLLV